MQTFVPHGFMPQAYTGTTISLEKFYEKAALAIDVNVPPSQAPPPLEHDAPPGLPTDAQITSISLDQIMQNSSTKENEGTS